MHPLYEKANAVSADVYEAALEVQKYFGVGLPESLYQKCLVVEAKALDEDKVNMPRHKAQCLSYMKLMDLPLGLVINFGDPRLGRSGIARVILKGANTADL